MQTENNTITLSGFLPVVRAVTNKWRTIYYVLIEQERYDKIKNSKLRKPEQQQYRRIFDECKKRQIEIRFAGSDVFAQIENSGGIAACVSERSFLTAEQLVTNEHSFIVCLDGIEDPYNFGYILRTLYLSGTTAVVLPKKRDGLFGTITAKSSAGVSEIIDIAICEDLPMFCKHLSQKGVKIVSSGIENSVSMYDAELKKPLMLVIGGERRGISRSVLELSDEVIRIDYAVNQNISLAAVSAASVLAFEVYRKNRNV